MEQSTSVTLEEIGKQIDADAAKPADLSTIKLEGDAIPEHLRGKSVADLMSFTKGVEESLRKSEDARKTAPPVVERVIERAAAPAPVEAAKAPTKEQLAELFQSDPVAALELYGNHVATNVINNLEQRIGPLRQGSAQAAEREAKERYKDEFALFGDQIEGIKKGLADPSVLSQPQSWDDLMAYVRGQPQNFDKLYEHRTKKRDADERSREAAQLEQVTTAPAHFAPQLRTPAPSGGGAVQMDDLTKEIARNLFSNLEPEDAYKEYQKWAKVR